MPRRYICYGVGGIGGTICAKLVQNGAEAVAIARGDHLRAIQSGGLRLRTPSEDVILPVAAVSEPSELVPKLCASDVVIVSTKSQQAAAVFEALLSVSSPGDEPAIVCCTNGLGTEMAALRYFQRVYGMLVVLGGTHLVPGEVRCFNHAGPHGWLDIGSFPRGIDSLAEEIAADFRNAEFSCVADPDIMAKKRTKLLSNVNNCLAITQGYSRESESDAPMQARRELDRRLRAEAEAVFRAANLAYYPPDTWKAMRPDLTSGVIAGDQSLRGGSSTWQSLRRGTGDTECDWLNGEIALLGRLHGVPTPANTLLQALARQVAQTHGGVGALNPVDVLARLPESRL